jgi:CRISPR-associated protein Csh1
LATERLWEELLVVAREYLMEAAESGNAYGLLNEGVGKKGTYLTLAGWVKHLARTLYFFRQLEVYPQMNSQRYEPKRDELRAFFQNAEATAGLDSPEKVYAFLLGVLFGKVMEVQGARGVNVGANALTWLKRMNLTGDDLPGLYIKVREKLLAYDTEKSARVRAVIEELGHLGAQIGKPRLSKTDAGYYVLLGQSLTKTLIPAKEAQV